MKKGDLVLSGESEYEFIRMAGEYYYVKCKKTSQNVYKTNCELKSIENIVNSKSKIEYIKPSDAKNVFEEGLIEHNNSEFLKNKEISELLNKPNNCKWEDLLPIIPTNLIDCILIDPPYGMNWKSNRRKDVSRRHDKIENDDNLDWITGLADGLYRVLKDDSHAYIFCSHHFYEIFKIEFSKKFRYKNTLIWDKKQGNLGDLKGDYSTYTEFCLFLTKGKGKNLNGGRDSNILRTTRTLNELHPTQKPVNLIKYLISKSTNKGDLVLDCFSGSFSTLKACKESGRDFIGCEIVKKYCDEAENEIKRHVETLF